MMILHLDGEIRSKMFTQLVSALNNLGEEDSLIIYFSSTGGGTDVAEAIIDLINKNHNRVGIIFYGEIFSAGMHVFLKTLCEKYILPDTRGMYHYSWQDLTITEGGRPSSSYDRFCMNEMKKSQKKTLDYLKTTSLTEKEIASIRRGDDVYFSNERMQQLIDGTE